MTGGITYDGVASDEGGNIFRGKSFWVAQRVPMRSSIVERIRVSYVLSTWAFLLTDLMTEQWRHHITA